MAKLAIPENVLGSFVVLGRGYFDAGLTLLGKSHSVFIDVVTKKFKLVSVKLAFVEIKYQATRHQALKK